MALSARQIDYAMRLLREKRTELMQEKRTKLGLTPEAEKFHKLITADGPSWTWFRHHYSGTFCLLRTKGVLDAIEESSSYDAVNEIKKQLLQDDNVLEAFKSWVESNGKKFAVISKKIETLSDYDDKSTAELKAAETELNMGKDASALEAAMNRLTALFA